MLRVPRLAGLCGAVAVALLANMAGAQDMMRHVDLTSPLMSEADVLRLRPVPLFILYQ